MKKILFVLMTGIILYVGLLLSCSKPEEDDCGPFTNRFKVNGINMKCLKLIDYDSLSNDYQFDSISSNDTLSIDNFFIELDPVKEFYIAGNSIKRFSIISEAYACSPPIPFSETSIDYITMTCNKDYDSSHKAGVDLISKFDVIVLDIYKNIINYRLSLKDFIYLRPNAKDRLYLVLNKEPEKSDSYKFEITYMQTQNSNQALFKMETKEIKIKI